MKVKDLNEIIKPYWEQNWWPKVEINEGWCDLVYDLHNKIVALEPNYKLHQIKEKFAGLRFYYQLPNDVNLENEILISELVDNAEKESYITCESCGTKNDVQMVSVKRWLTTKCKDCLSVYAPEDINYDTNIYKSVMLV